MCPVVKIFQIESIIQFLIITGMVAQNNKFKTSNLGRFALNLPKFALILGPQVYYVILEILQ